jgi:ElaB/YqjD/DUF883 family membrane-anchored ribosome-binding protein
MQKSYVVLKKLNLTFASFHIDTGDILVYDAENNHNVAIYRNQKLVKTTTYSQLGINALVRDKHIELIASPTDETPITDPDPEKLTFLQKIEVAALAAAIRADDVISTGIANLKDLVSEGTTKTEAAVAPVAEVAAEVTAAPTEAVSEVKDVATEATNTVEQTTETAVDATKDVVTTVETAPEKVEADVEAIPEKVETVVESIPDKVEAAVESVPEKVEAAADAVAVDFSKMTKVQLLAHAEDNHGLTLDPKQSNAKIIAAINQAATTTTSTTSAS